MKWQDIGDIPCSIARSLAVLGDRWTLMVLRNAFLGIKRFDDFQTNLGVTRHVLADRLQRLVEAGVFAKVPYQQKPERFEYQSFVHFFFTPRIVKRTVDPVIALGSEIRTVVTDPIFAVVATLGTSTRTVSSPTRTSSFVGLLSRRQTPARH